MILPQNVNYLSPSCPPVAMILPQIVNDLPSPSCLLLMLVSHLCVWLIFLFPLFLQSRMITGTPSKGVKGRGRGGGGRGEGKGREKRGAGFPKDTKQRGKVVQVGVPADC